MIKAARITRHILREKQTEYYSTLKTFLAILKVGLVHVIIVEVVISKLCLIHNKALTHDLQQNHSLLTKLGSFFSFSLHMNISEGEKH